MKYYSSLLAGVFGLGFSLGAADVTSPFAADPGQVLERTCFQTDRPFTEMGDLRSDVAICYGIDPGLPKRIQSWRDQGYRIHVMTGISWGNYQDYQYGRFDGINHEDEAQTDRNGKKIGHGGDVYYMCPGTNYGKFICVGVQRALDAGTEAIHLEEPEFWVRSGYSEGFKREWRNYYGEDWQAPHTSVDAQWRSSKLKYFLYRRALQQVFDYVQDYNRRTGRHVRCYVPTHSLINYANWGIVSPESSLSRLNGCDGYIAQVWTGTARSANIYKGKERERTFETAFLEYGSMQNLVRATGRTVWYLNDPIEDNPNHDWHDYQVNWESTLTASLLQPEVWQFEVAPWPERIFSGRYPARGKAENRKSMPAAYATELQTVINTLNDMKQSRVEWDCGTTGIGVMVSDSLMFQRGDPTPSDPHLSNFYGLALPFVKRGMPVAPIQLENVTIPHYLDSLRTILLTYHGMKPLSPEVHQPLVDWVKNGGVLVVCDDDSDPYRNVRDWWNTNGNTYATPREHLFKTLGIQATATNSDQGETLMKVGKGGVIWMRANPAQVARKEELEQRLVDSVKNSAGTSGLKWRETNYLLLRRGPYVIAAGLDETVSGPSKSLHGRFVNLFDSELKVQTDIEVAPASRLFLLDLDAVPAGDVKVLASACKALPQKSEKGTLSLVCDGVENTPAVILARVESAPKKVTVDGNDADKTDYSEKDHLLWIKFQNGNKPRQVNIVF